MADFGDFVVLETPPEMKRASELKDPSPSPEIVGEREETPVTDSEREESPLVKEQEQQTQEEANEQPPTETTNEENTTVDPTPDDGQDPTTTATTEDTVPTEDDKDEQPSGQEEPKDQPSEPTVTEGDDTTQPEQKESEETLPPTEEITNEDPKETETEPKQEDNPAIDPEPPSSPEQTTSTQVAEPAAPIVVPTTKHRPPVAISGKQIKQLLTGTELLKAKKGTKVYPRLFYITGDLIRLVWNSKRKPIAKSQIALSQISDIITGRQSPSFQLYRGTQDSDRCFTIVYQDNGTQRNIDLIASSPEEAKLWINSLLALTGDGVSESTTEVRKKWLRYLFDKADANGDGTLDLKEILKMLKQLNIGISQKTLRKKFKEADSSGNSDNKLDFDEFCDMFTTFTERPELRVLFNLYASSDDGSYMTVDDLLNFLNTEQDNDTATLEYCQSVVERFEPSDSSRQHLLSLDGFTQFLQSDENGVFNRSHSEVYQDMTQPLAHYFIASSHNTYLLEDQLQGPSSVDAYITALKKGCRCVELDCWDGDNNEPIVYHGHTLTSKILFKDCIAAIKDHAFVTSLYPVILSIENHCSVAQQHVMADHLNDILGDILFKDERQESLGKLPSPEDLKGKILIKAKKLPKEYEDKDDDDGEVSDEDEGAEVDKEELKKAKESSQPAQPPVRADSPDEIPEGEQQSQTEIRKVVRDRSSSPTSQDEQKPAAKRKLSNKLSKCVNYVQSVHFKGFEETVNVPFFHMSSFGESSAFKYSDTKAASYIEYNKLHLSRTYPAGRRVDSSNYEPMDLWNCGCQIVALNYQTNGKAMDYNIGKFQQNGGCGYILKPAIMREDYSYFNHKQKDATNGITPKVVSIRVISGQCLPKPEDGDKDGEIIDPYVTVKFVGMPVDTASFRTKHINDNGFNPVWNETFTKVVSFPELALVRICVMDYDVLTRDDFIGQYTLPISSLNTGYRTIKLRKSNWDTLENGSLFVEIRVQEWVGPKPKSKEKLRLIPAKKTRQYPTVKLLAYPKLDTIFKNAKISVHTSTDIREDYYYQLMFFKETCGKSTIPDCMEAISSKAHSARVQLKLVATERPDVGTVYHIEVAGETTPTRQTGVTGSLMSFMNAFNKLNTIASIVLSIGNRTADELDEFHSSALQQQKDFFGSLAEPNQQKKAESLKAAYSSNVMTIHNESLELRKVHEAVLRVLEKIPKFAEKFGIPVTTPAQATPTPAAPVPDPVEEKPTETDKKETEPKQEEPKEQESESETTGTTTTNPATGTDTNGTAATTDVTGTNEESSDEPKEVTTNNEVDTTESSML